MGREDRELVPLGSAFDLVRRGYDRAQVDEHLERVDADLRILSADRDAAVARAAELAKQVENQRTQIQKLQEELDRAVEPPTTLEGLSERLARMLRLAQEEAADIRAKAEEETAAAVARAEADAVSLRDRYQGLINELEDRRAQMEAEHQAVMAKANAEAERLVSETTEQVRRFEEESAARHRQIEEDFDIAMASRRTEAMGLLADQEAASKAEAERRVQEATAEADRRLKDATERSQHQIMAARAEVDELRAVRARIAGQLREARSVLAAATNLLEPLPEEQPSAEPLVQPAEARIEEPVAEESLAEESLAEEPLAEEPVAEESLAGEHAEQDEPADRKAGRAVAANRR
jgi:DivIVA domain-containing protein